MKSLIARSDIKDIAVLDDICFTLKTPDTGLLTFSHASIFHEISIGDCFGPDELVGKIRVYGRSSFLRIQSFPDWFEFRGVYTTGGKERVKSAPRYTQVGNAVPPLFAEQLGLAIRKSLEND